MTAGAPVPAGAPATEPLPAAAPAIELRDVTRSFPGPPEVQALKGVNVSIADGTVLSTVDTNDPISLPPVVAGNTLYVLGDDGRLTAWR